MIKIVFLQLILLCSTSFTAINAMDEDMQGISSNFSHLILSNDQILPQWLHAIENRDEETIQYFIKNYPDCRAMGYAYRFGRNDIVHALLNYIKKDDWDMVYGYICVEKDFEAIRLALDIRLPHQDSIKNFLFMTVTSSNDITLQMKLKECELFDSCLDINEQYISRRAGDKYGKKIWSDPRYYRTKEQRNNFWRNIQN